MEQEEQEKAFVYRWHVEATKKYYLGSSIGKDKYYTHSSNDKEFCSYVPSSSNETRTPVAERREFLANMPEGITREIITYGTYKKMLTLERTLQLHAKEHCWEEYYNDNVCDGVYNGFGTGEDHYMSGKTPENHPSYTHGRAVGASKDPKIRASYGKEYREDTLYDDKRYAKNKEETGYAIGYSRAKKKVKKIPKKKVKKVNKIDKRTAFFKAWQEALWSST